MFRGAAQAFSNLNRLHQNPEIMGAQLRNNYGAITSLLAGIPPRKSRTFSLGAFLKPPALPVFFRGVFI
jgi:hypothetical protein